MPALLLALEIFQAWRRPSGEVCFATEQNRLSVVKLGGCVSKVRVSPALPAAVFAFHLAFPPLPWRGAAGRSVQGLGPPARSPWPQGSCPRGGLRLLLKTGLGGPSVRGLSRLAPWLLVPSPPCPWRGASRCRQPSLAASPPARVSPGRWHGPVVLPGPHPRGRGTGGGRGERAANVPLAGRRGKRRRKHRRGWLPSALALPVCRGFIAVSSPLRYEPNSDHLSVLWPNAKLRGLKAAWQRPCGDYFVGSGANVSLPLPGVCLASETQV